MEDEQVFEAEANVDIAMPTRLNNGQAKPRRLGEDTVIAAEGGAEGRTRTQSIDDEDTPLLRDSERGAGGGKDGRDGDSGGAWMGMVEFEGLPWWKRPSIYWMLPPFLLSALAWGGIFVPKLDLYLALICRQYLADRSMVDPNFTVVPVVFGGDNPQCRIPEVQSRVAQFTLFMTLISGLLAAVSSPKLGALSDRYGRKRIILMTNVGLVCVEVITILAATYPETFPVNLFLLGAAIDGLCGSFIAAMALSNAYATDCTPPALRNVSFSYFHGCLFTGIAIGPVLAGYIIKAAGTILSIFYIGLGCHLFFITFLAFIIPESLSRSRQLAAREKYRIEREELGPSSDWINQIRSFNLFEPLKVLYPSGEGSNGAIRRNLIVLAAVDTICFGVAMGSMTVVIYYTNIQFGWGTLEKTQFVSIVNSCRVSFLLVVFPLVARLIRGRSGTAQQRSSGCDNVDLYTIRFAIFADILGYLGYTTASKGSYFILAGAIASVGGIASPTLQSSLTKHVPSDKVGQLLGATGLLHALARVVSPTIFNGIYSVTVGNFRQTVFVCLTATFGLAFICSWFVRPHVHLDESGEQPSGPQAGSDAES